MYSAKEPAEEGGGDDEVLARLSEGGRCGIALVWLRQGRPFAFVRRADDAVSRLLPQQIDVAACEL